MRHREYEDDITTYAIFVDNPEDERPEERGLEVFPAKNMVIPPRIIEGLAKLSHASVEDVIYTTMETLRKDNPDIDFVVVSLDLESALALEAAANCYTLH
ncbi:MAG: hypothetical protein D6698_15790 [Gammaproteobacteria bacterium]|nr:MAG: hypothetical protein D6698_15790 [Gammaproteobacteria bacterium]